MNVMNRMPVISIVFGILLDAVGVTAFVLTGATHKTALIPCIVGMLIFAAGIIATKPSLLKHAMHGAAMVGLIGFLAGASRFIMGTLVIIRGGEVSHIAYISTGTMALLCGVFVALCVKSFIEARKARQAAA